MADHSKPVLTSTYANFVTELDARFDDLAVGLDPAFSTPTNLPNNSIRWSSASNKWEKWNLTVWSPLSAGYDIDIANGSIINSPISGSTGSFTSLVASGAFSLTGDQVQVSEGGTGATTAATARANLGAAPTASPVFTGPVSVNDGVGEGQILVGANDGFFYANANSCGWYSPTLGSFAYNFSDDQFYINGQKAWHQGNDGAGSGLDADLLDGQQGSYYAPTASPTFTGVPAAPTAAAGTNTTQLATTAFVQAATPAASASVAGLVGLATNAEVAAGTDALRAITPAGLDSVFLSSLAANGYQKLPSGLIIQWGQSTEGANGTFPITFPTAALAIFATLNSNTPVSDGAVTEAFIVSSSQFRVRVGADSSNPLYWFAIGY